MNTFESLLLKIGSPDLICAFVNEYHDILSEDFFQNLSLYQKEMSWKISNTLSDNYISTEMLNMKMNDFIQSFGSELSQFQETRLKNILCTYKIRTIKDLLEYSYKDLRHMPGMGETIRHNLIIMLEKVGLKLKN